MLWVAEGRLPMQALMFLLLWKLLVLLKPNDWEEP